MPLQFEKINPATTSKAIAEFEAAWKIMLPEDYQQFLLKTNGGIGYGRNYIPYLHAYRSKTGDREEIISFAGVNEVYGLPSPDGKLYNPDLHTVNVRIKAGDGKRSMCLPDTIVIADDGNGHNYFGIVISPSRYGQVHFWDDHNPDFEWSLKIGDSFTEFLEKIIDDPEAY